MIDNNGAWQLVTDQLTATDTSFIDDIRPFGASTGHFCYFVKAVEADNPVNFVDEYGQAFNCSSNQVCVTQNARVFVPTAFNPNSDVEENRVWKPTNVFARTNSYELSVYNRWGDKVFYTTDLNEAWDGTFQNEPQPMGVYTFLLKYRSLEGVPIEERGSFTIVR
jgi:gliding motility-associated-like protein